MIRLLLIAAALPFLSGCVSNPGNYYSYEGSGDYYYEDAGADIYLDSYPFGYGSGYGGGLGYGWGGYAGIGLGFGFGGYYGGYGYPWGYYGYSPIWWSPPTVIVVDSPRWRPGVEEERARRVALSHRPDGADYPESATWARRDRAALTSRRTGLTQRGTSRTYGRAPVGTVSRPGTAAAKKPAVQSSRSAAPVPRSYSRPSSGSRSMRSSPAPRSSGRKH